MRDEVFDEVQPEPSKIRGLLIAAHQAGLSPYMYHTSDESKRVHHYKATFTWTAAMVFIATTSFYLTNFNHSEEVEHHWFNVLDHFGHQLFAGVILAAVSAVAAVLAGGAHLLMNSLFCVKDRSDYSIKLKESTNDGRVVAINEETGLVGGDDNANFFRISGNCHPLNAIYPATPLKTLLWVGGIMLLGFTLGTLINPTLFNEIAGDRAWVNGTLVNCTINSTLLMHHNQNHTVCPPDALHNAAMVTLGAGTALIFGGVATLFHRMGASVEEGAERRKARAALPF